jgi:predicted phosphoribosyltransferase
VAIPEPFQAVGMWYRNFAQTTDEEVRTLLGHGTAGSPTAEAIGRTADRKKHYATQS